MSSVYDAQRQREQRRVQTIRGLARHRKCEWSDCTEPAWGWSCEHGMDRDDERNYRSLCRPHVTMHGWGEGGIFPEILTGVPHTDEHNERIRAASKIRANTSEFKAEFRQRMGTPQAAENRRKAMTTPDYRAKIGARSKATLADPKNRAAHIARLQSDEVRAKISAKAKERLSDPARRAALSASLRGRPAWNKGRSMSDEAKANMREGAKHRPPVSEETRAKMRAARARQEAAKRS